MNEDSKIVRKDLGKILGISDVQALISTALSNYFTKGESDERYVKKDEPTPTPTLVRVEWRNATITPNPVDVGQTATISGNVFAVYSDNTETDVTAMATYSADGGTISGNTFTANAADTYSICANYQGYASAGVEVVVQEVVQRKTVQLGVGTTTDYTQIVFTDTNRQLTNNFSASFDVVTGGSYLFIKTDKDDTVNNMYTAGGFPFPITLAPDPIIAGDYKYYRSANGTESGTLDVIINKV